jgi:hypothetical protein
VPGPPSENGLLTQRWAVAAVAVIYLFVLHSVYQHQISPAFSYLKYTYRAPDPVHYGIAILLVVMLALVLPRRITQPSHFICWTLFVVAVAPSIVVPQYTDVLTSDAALEVAIWVAISFLPVAVLGCRRAVRDSLPQFTVSPSLYWGTLAVISAFVYAYVIADVGITFDLPSLEDVYGVRGEYAAVEASSSKLLSYATPLLANVINPLFVARGLISRRWVWLTVGLLGQVFIFSFTGYRSAFLSPIAMLAVFLLFSRRSRPASVVVLLGVVVLSLGMWALDQLSGTLDFTSLLVRRFLITPGLLTGAYVWLFTDIEKAHLAHSFLKPFLQYPYSREPPQLIGELFFGNSGTNANANLLADGFANFGFPGMLMECLVLMVVLWVIDDACRGLSVRVAGLVFVMPTLSLADSGLFTTLLTHGMGAATLACLLMPRTGWGPEPAPPPAPANRRARRHRRARYPVPTTGKENEQT